MVQESNVKEELNSLKARLNIDEENRETLGTRNMVYCRGCAATIHESAPTCPKCGATQGAQQSRSLTENNNGLLIFVVCIFLGVLGIHRFMVGKVGTGLLMLFTGGGFMIWWIVDIIVIATGSFTDKEGDKVVL